MRARRMMVFVCPFGPVVVTSGVLGAVGGTCETGCPLVKGGVACIKALGKVDGLGGAIFC